MIKKDKGKGLKNAFLSKLSEGKRADFKHLNWHINFGFNVEKILFARILATLLQSGINIADALVILEEQFTGRFKYIVKLVRNDVESGSSLSAALTKHPKYFNNIYVGLINVGESSGKLIECLSNVADHQEKDLELSRKVQSASLYPAIVFLCLLSLSALLSYYILPQLVVIFTSFYMTMPLSTRILLWFSNFIRDYGPIVLISIIAIIIFIKFIIKTDKVRPYWQGFLMSIPFFGEMMKKLNLARFSRILGTLLQSGVPINDAIDTTIASLTNEVYKIQIIKAKKQVMAGMTLGESIGNLHKTKIFPKLVSQMISVGERTGTLEGNLIYLAEFYEKEVDNTSKNLSSVIEPILLIIVGFVVAFIAVAIISPIYEFITTLSHSI